MENNITKGIKVERFFLSLVAAILIVGVICLGILVLAGSFDFLVERCGDQQTLQPLSVKMETDGTRLLYVGRGVVENVFLVKDGIYQFAVMFESSYPGGVAHVKAVPYGIENPQLWMGGAEVNIYTLYTTGAPDHSVYLACRLDE